MNNGIWKYHDLLPQIEEKFRITLNEGSTPLECYPQLNEKFQIENLYLKREDLNPTGSHKDRSIAYYLSKSISEGITKFAISSSGNSAISAINYIKSLNNPEISLAVFLSSDLSSAKLARLEKALGQEINTSQQNSQIDSFNINFSLKPLSSAIQYSSKEKARLIRGSTDDLAIEGFKTLAVEIWQQANDASDIFIPTSSGTTALGIFQGYKKLSEISPMFKMPRIHIVQTTSVNPIAREFDKNFTQTSDNLSDCIVDRVAHRRKEILEIVKQSGGSGWVISDNEINETAQVLTGNDLDLSTEGLLSIAALNKAKHSSWEIFKPICIITGTKH